MKTYSIEYAHIYTNEHYAKEQSLYKKEIDLLINTKNRIEASLVVMIDDYSFPDPNFNYSQFINHLEKDSYKPDIIIRESQLIPYCDIILSEIKNGKLKQSIKDYIISHKKYPCSLFIATWYSIRLGLIKTPLLPKKETARNLINILPESFKYFEEKGFEILLSTQYKDYITNIKNKYIDGRII